MNDSKTDEWRDALTRHGYNPDHAPRGVTGDPSFAYQMTDGTWLRNRVCELDGILIDGHEVSDLDYGGPCIHCGKDWDDWASDD